MNRTRNQIDAFHSRYSSFHKPGVVPRSSRRISPITSNGHKYELKQKIWPKQTVESWFEHHSPEERRAVYSFLNTLYDVDGQPAVKEDRSAIFRQAERREKSFSPKLPHRINSSVNQSSTYSLQRPVANASGRNSRASKRDLGEILESLESHRPSLFAQDKGIQTSATPITVALPNVNGTKNDRPSANALKRSMTSMEKYTEVVAPNGGTVTPINPTSTTNDEENSKVSRRYLSHTWRVINPRDDMEPNVRPENNSSSFFNYTKKVYPEYFFIHPDWY